IQDATVVVWSPHCLKNEEAPPGSKAWGGASFWSFSSWADFLAGLAPRGDARLFLRGLLGLALGPVLLDQRLGYLPVLAADHAEDGRRAILTTRHRAVLD